MRRAMLALAILLAGCGDDVELTQGYIIERDYKRAHWSDNDTSLFGRDWDDKECDSDWEYDYSTGEHEWVEDCKYWYDDLWRFRLQDCYSEPGDCKEDWIEVEEDDYDEFRNGEHYPRPR